MLDLIEVPPVPPLQSVEGRGDTNPFPYVIWRGPAAMYFTRKLDLFSGPPAMSLQIEDCWFQHPEIVAGASKVTSELRVAIESFANLPNQAKRPFDLCIVWGLDDGTYIGRDGRVTRSSSLPKSRVGL